MIINDYKLVEKIGRGSYGEVWKGINIQKSNNVAIKISKKSIKNILKMEIIILRHLKHLKVVPSVKYFGQTLNFDYIIMELLGDKIDDYYFGITEQTLGEIKWIGLKMLNCLKEIHNNGIIHRDIKPDNFLITKNKKDVKIIDFGLAKQYIDKNGKHKPCIEHLNIIGTLRYISKNVHEGQEPSRRDDLISFVYILIFLLNKRLPWQQIKGENKEERILKVYNIKKNITYEKFCSNISYKIKDMLDYVYNLKYEESPSYEYLSFLLTTIE